MIINVAFGKQQNCMAMAEFFRTKKSPAYCTLLDTLINMIVHAPPGKCLV